MEQKLSDTLVKTIDRSNPMMQNLQLASRFNKLVEQGGGGIIAEPLAVTENGVYTAPSGKAYSPVTVNVPSVGSDAFRYFDGRESGYPSNPTGFWVIRKDQTFGNAYCVSTEGFVSEQAIQRVTSDSLSVDPNGRENFPEVTVDVDYFITALVYKGIKD